MRSLVSLHQALANSFSTSNTCDEDLCMTLLQKFAASQPHAIEILEPSNFGQSSDISTLSVRFINQCLHLPQSKSSSVHISPSQPNAGMFLNRGGDEMLTSSMHTTKNATHPSLYQNNTINFCPMCLNWRMYFIGARSQCKNIVHPTR